MEDAIDKQKALALAKRLRRLVDDVFVYVEDLNNTEDADDLPGGSSFAGWPWAGQTAYKIFDIRDVAGELIKALGMDDDERRGCEPD